MDLAKGGIFSLVILIKTIIHLQLTLSLIFHIICILKLRTQIRGMRSSTSHCRTTRTWKASNALANPLFSYPTIGLGRWVATMGIRWSGSDRSTWYALGSHANFTNEINRAHDWWTISDEILRSHHIFTGPDEAQAKSHSYTLIVLDDRLRF